MLYKVTERFGYIYKMEKKAFNIQIRTIRISDPAAKTSVLQTAYRIAQEASTADDCSKSADTNIASTSTETASCAEKVHALTKFCKNFYGDNANMDGTLDMKKNLYHDKEVEKLLCNRLCNMCIISNSSTPSSEISGSFEKSSNSEGFSDNEYFDVSTKCLPPHQNIMINLTPLAPILRYKSQLKLLCQLWNSTHCFTTS